MFQNPFSFEGRIRRSEFGISFIIYMILYLILSLIISENPPETSYILLIFWIPLLWFLWAQSAKRCHDVGNSGWWQLIPFYFFWLLFQDGQPGSNQYGENPKGINSNMGVSSNQSPGSNSPNPKVHNTTYMGGYSGGHNNTSMDLSSPESENDSGYKSGDLYN